MNRLTKSLIIGFLFAVGASTSYAQARDTGSRTQGVTGTDPRPQGVTGTDPRPQSMTDGTAWADLLESFGY